MFNGVRCCSVQVTGPVPMWPVFAFLAVCGLLLLAVLVFGGTGSGGTPGGDDSGGGGGGSGRDPDTPRPGGGAGDDPEWWPDFERQFAEYVATRERPAWRLATRRSRTTMGTGTATRRFRQASFRRRIRRTGKFAHHPR